MAMVFVHGIGNRKESDLGDEANLRDKLFKKYLLSAFHGPAAEKIPIISPPWGFSHGADLHWNHACLPIGAGESMDVSAGDLSDLAATAAKSGSDPIEPSQVVMSTARASMRDAIDLLFASVDLHALDAGEVGELADLAELLEEYCTEQEFLAPGLCEEQRYPWLANSVDDDDFMDLLLRNSRRGRTEASVESLSVRAALDRASAILSGATDRIKHALVGVPVTRTANGARRLAGKPISLLLGDVFTYLNDPKGIVEVVAGGICEGISETRPGEPLVVVAHSMGGNIVYDILSNFRKDLNVDLLVTVGSQVGLFAELWLFESVRAAELPTEENQKVPRLPNVGRWINVVDRSDVLAYRASPIFEGAEDYDYPTNAAWAHSAYFRQPNFHSRLVKRVKEAPA